MENVNVGSEVRGQLHLIGQSKFVQIKLKNVVVFSVTFGLLHTDLLVLNEQLVLEHEML